MGVVVGVGVLPGLGVFVRVGVEPSLGVVVGVGVGPGVGVGVSVGVGPWRGCCCWCWATLVVLRGSKDERLCLPFKASSPTFPRYSRPLMT